MITLIAAADEANGLGKDNDLVWHLPDDFKRFKNLTTGHCIIMGRKTYESFPKPLPNRTHIVITRNTDYRPEFPADRADDIEVVHSMNEALSLCEHDAQPYIIGGGEIYNIGMEVAHKIELTRVHGTFDVDTYFPEIPKEQWELIKSERHDQDDKHAVPFTYETWIKK